MSRLDEIRDAIAKDGGKGLLIAMRGRIDSAQNQEMLCVIEALTARAEKAEGERDAAIHDLGISAHCKTCMHHCGVQLAMAKRDGGSCMEYKWRGIQGDK